MMELGALICLPRNPRCVECALRRHCRAFREHSQHDFPRRGKRKAIPHLKVGAGVIVDDRDRVLIAQRREGDMLGGLWEFPGGKCEAGETMRGCIRRELREEMGIDTRVHGHLMTVKHAYSHFTMDLHAYWCTVVSGRPRAIECAAVKWVARSELERFAMSKADDRIRARVVQKR
jgi:A/G-specific adenine glycosylase